MFSFAFHSHELLTETQNLTNQDSHKFYLYWSLRFFPIERRASCNLFPAPFQDTNWRLLLFLVDFLVSVSGATSMKRLCPLTVFSCWGRLNFPRPTVSSHLHVCSFCSWITHTFYSRKTWIKQVATEAKSSAENWIDFLASLNLFFFGVFVSR